MNQRSIVYDRRGSGPPLLLLHGLGHERQAWQQVMNRLADEFDCIAVDLPGFGESPAPEPAEAYSVATLVDTLVRLCDDLSLDGAHVAGNSLGGALALELGSRDAARSVTALAPVGFAMGRTRQAALLGALAVGLRLPPVLKRAAVDSAPGRLAASLTLHGRTADPAVTESNFHADALDPGSPFARLAGEVIRYTYAASPPSVPVTVAWGDNDRVLPVRQANHASQHLPHARLVRLLGAGHLCMMDAPDAVAAAIRETCAHGEVAAPSTLRTGPAGLA